MEQFSRDSLRRDGKFLPDDCFACVRVTSILTFGADASVCEQICIQQNQPPSQSPWLKGL